MDQQTLTRLWRIEKIFVCKSFSFLVISKQQSFTRDPETNEYPLKMDGWNTSLSLWKSLFSGAMSMLVSGRVSSTWPRPVSTLLHVDSFIEPWKPFGPETYEAHFGKCSAPPSDCLKTSWVNFQELLTQLDLSPFLTTCPQQSKSPRIADKFNCEHTYPEDLAWRLATSLRATSTVVKTVGNAAASIWDHAVGRSISNFGSCRKGTTVYHGIPLRWGSKLFPSNQRVKLSSLTSYQFTDCGPANQTNYVHFWGAIQTTCSCVPIYYFKTICIDCRCDFTSFMWWCDGHMWHDDTAWL